MIRKETVLSGAEHPGTKLQVMSSGGNFYLGFSDEDGMPYSRESHYFADREDAEQTLNFLRS